MTEEPHAKSFKSGNSVAIRIPAPIGLKPGAEFTVKVNEDGDLVLTRIPAQKERIDLSDIYGKAKPIERVPFDQSGRDWHADEA